MQFAAIVIGWPTTGELLLGESVHDGMGRAFTVTVVCAMFPAPLPFEGVTPNVVVCVMLTLCEPVPVNAASPLAGGDAVHAKRVGELPPEQ